MSVRRLVIDIGTNSVLALLADIDGDALTVISDQKKTTRLGEGMISGNLSSAAMRRTAEAVIEFAKNSHYDELIMVGTEALRLAHNASEFTKMLRDFVGQEPVIVTGLKEAELTFRGVMYNLDLKFDNLLLIDVGGGSTELIRAVGNAISQAVSVPIGALKLKESVSENNLAAYQNRAREAISKTDFNFDRDSTVLATGGTITSVAAIKRGMNYYDSRPVHGSRLTVGEMLEIASRFEMADTAGRAGLIPFDPERADLILPGLGIFLAVMGIIDRKELIVSVGGVRFGAALNPGKLLS